MECFDPLMDELLKASQIPCHLDFPATSILHGDDDRHSDPLLLVLVHLPLDQGLMGSTTSTWTPTWHWNWSSVVIVAYKDITEDSALSPLSTASLAEVVWPGEAVVVVVAELGHLEAAAE
ncbi:hypothetical protein E2542_SST19509 [Spatholobus suberectus]|nr:hypothetical protein E2542_SST19509 [Spatholobus suberectus]